MKRSKITLVLVLIFGVLISNNLYAACTADGTNWISSADVASINSCLSQADAGDTITVTGNATWDSGISTITKAVNLIGSGTPIITRGTSYTGALVRIKPSSGNPAIRISGFRFESGKNVAADRISILATGGNNGSGGLTNIRIDSNYFNKGRRAIFLQYYIEALIDNNTFNNCDIGVMILGDDHYSWNREIVPGTVHANFIENNTFIADEANRDVNLNQMIYHQSGGRSVTRYNTFDLSAVTGSGGASFYDSHGNQGDTLPFSTFRGQPLVEIYNNYFKGHTALSFGHWIIDIRGGSSLIYNNDFYTTSSGTPYPIMLWEEEAWTSGGPFTTKPYDTTWPAEDQIFNSFFWNNRTFFNGASSPTALTDIALRDTTTESVFIQKDRDYFMHTPQETGGKATLTNSGSPYYMRTNSMSFSGIGANAYASYTPYNCPHPLAGSGSCDISAVGKSGYNVTATTNPLPTMPAPAMTYSLSVTSSYGTVTSSPSGINCGSTCTYNYEADTSVTLTPAANSGYTFAGWSGACTGSGSCVVTMTDNRSVTATFTENKTYYDLTASKTGNGRITATPAGIDCGSTCSASYESGTSVMVTATADTGYTFTNWSGACTGSGACTVSMTSPKSVSATFTKDAEIYALTTSKTGNGLITGNPAGINCGPTCSYNYDENTSIALTAVADSGYTFSGWSGACSGIESCTVLMTSPKSVSATFTKDAEYYTLTTNNSGNGTITSTPSGINCGATCAYSYESGKSVTLSAAADNGYTFSGWSGACSGKETCQVTMDTAKTVSAAFVAEAQPVLTISKPGVGKGRVKSTDARIASSSLPTNTGIDCGDICVETYATDTTVTLIAEPESGSSFAGWSNACSGTGHCIVNVSQETTVTATFISASSSTPPPTSAPPSADGGGGGGCFIATAAFGSYLDPHVMVLREFRDKVLLKNYAGRAFVKFYYRNSPPIADRIAQNAALKILTRAALTPFIYALAYPNATAVVFLTALLILLMARRRKMITPIRNMSETYFEHGPKKAFVRVR